VYASLFFACNYSKSSSRSIGQIVASYLTRDVNVDWRLGAMHFESLLVDHDPCSNWGNWTYGAGVGSDPREDRYFSIPRQTQVYDPSHQFIRLWVDEIRHHSADEITRSLTRGTRRQADNSAKAQQTDSARASRHKLPGSTFRSVKQGQRRQHFHAEAKPAYGAQQVALPEGASVTASTPGDSLAQARAQGGSQSSSARTITFDRDSKRGGRPNRPNQ
jgi:hypothetical protein